ncbi:hypothetical protein [Vibrio alginolyticus]|uniref:hypothetical protein n=1 Tax=Vibrio alginolyticus TaxID=663 RepID=UPI001E60D179|nr:hypothetical protein [Vibrio alginolyticus]
MDWFSISGLGGRSQSNHPTVKPPQPVQAQLPDGTPTVDTAETKAKKKKKASGFGPLEDYDFYITGYAKQIAYAKRLKYAAELDRDLTFLQDIHRCVRWPRQAIQFRSSGLGKDWVSVRSVERLRVSSDLGRNRKDLHVRAKRKAVRHIAAKHACPYLDRSPQRRS